MLLNDVVEVSATIRATRSRLAKTASIADLLRRAAPDTVPLVVAYLSGDLPQGKIGVGYSLAYEVDPHPAADKTAAEADTLATVQAFLVD